MIWFCVSGFVLRQEDPVECQSVINPQDNIDRLRTKIYFLFENWNFITCYQSMVSKSNVCVVILSLLIGGVTSIWGLFQLFCIFIHQICIGSLIVNLYLVFILDMMRLILAGISKWLTLIQELCQLSCIVFVFVIVFVNLYS